MTRVYRIAGYDISPGHEKWNDGLAYCHKKSVRPLCMCTPQGVKMYVAKTKSGYCIKRMPKQGEQHAVTCPSYEAPRELSGRGYVDDAAISEDEKTGETALKVDFPLTKNKNAKAPEAPDGAPTDTVESVQKKLTLRALFDYLYDEAELNQYHPSERRKSYRYIRERLIQTLNNKRTKNLALDERVLIPEAFILDKKDEHFQSVRKFLSQLKPKNKTRPVGVLVGEFKAIEQARFGYKLLVKHLPSNPIFFDEKMHGKIEKAFSYELSVFAENEDAKVLVVTTFYVTESGNLQMDLCTMVPVNKDWIPFYSNDEKFLIDKLASDSVQFTKTLRYNIPSKEVIASVVIPKNDELLAVYCVPMGADSEYINSLDNVLEKTKADAMVIDFNSDSVVEAINGLSKTMALKDTSF